MLAPVFSALFGVWALMILFYFYRKTERDAEGAGKAFGVLASVLTVLNYPQIISYAERYLGAGAGWEATAHPDRVAGARRLRLRISSARQAIGIFHIEPALSARLSPDTLFRYNAPFAGDPDGQA